MIIRRKHTANFTTIGNDLFNDERLEADEIGVLAYLLSRPNDWEVRRPALAKRFHIGRDSIKRIIFNCTRCGWVVPKRTRLTNGTFHTIYEVRDQPGPTLTPEQVKDALSLVSSEAAETEEGDASGDIGNPTSADHLPETGPPDTGQPGVASQLRQTRPGPIEDSLKTDSLKPESPNGARAFVDVLSQWPPDHVLSSVAAESAFASLPEPLQEQCCKGVKVYLDDCRANTRKVCDLTTYIRERRWERLLPKMRGTGGVAVIKPGTPQWFRWRDHYVSIGVPVMRMDEQARRGETRTVPSEWPPAKNAPPLADTG